VGPPAVLGEYVHGGIVFWVDPNDNTKGLVCALTDQSAGIIWHATNDGTTGATATAIGTGQANTDEIIELYDTENNAAKLCDDFVLDGYSDWYLPSKDELNKMYENIGQGNTLGLGNVGGFAASGYWSSSENYSNFAWYSNFYDGYSDLKLKSSTYRVRAVRAF
jgi:hypothetical protein